MADRTGRRTRVVVHLTEECRSVLDALATRHGLPRSAVVELAVRKAGAALVTTGEAIASIAPGALPAH